LSAAEKPEPHPQPEKINFTNLPIYLIPQGIKLFRIHYSIFHQRNMQKYSNQNLKNLELFLLALNLVVNTLTLAAKLL
jgi:hypothetical protein